MFTKLYFSIVSSGSGGSALGKEKSMSVISLATKIIQ